MPNRIIRETILTSDKVECLDAPAEVFYRRLLSKVDDYGRYDARPSILRASLFPLRIDRVREADCTRWMAACQKAGLIALYSHADKPYLEVANTGWQARSPSRFPDPSQASANICAQVQTNARLDVDVVVDVVVEKPSVRQAARFAEFWTAFPARPGRAKPNRKGCEAKWKARGLDSLADRILADVAMRKRSDQGWIDGYAPNPETYLNQNRWEDGPPEAVASVATTSSIGVSPAKVETPASKIQEAKDAAARFVELGAWTPEQAQQHVAEVRAKHG